MGVSEEPERCMEHGLVVGPDGRCVLCRRTRAPAERATFSFAFALILFLLLVGGAVALYLLVWRSDDRTAARVASRRRPGASRGTRVLEKRPVLPGRSARPRHLRRVVLRVKPRPEPRVETKPEPGDETEAETSEERDEREALAARKRMNRLYEQAALQNAISQVSITMYMTDW